MTATVRDQSTGECITLSVNEPFILGRGGPFQIDNRYVSRRQVQLTLLDDGRCFAKRLASNPTLLDGKLLPLHQEIEVHDGSVIHLIPNTLAFEVSLERKQQEEQREEKHYYDDSNSQEYHTQQITQGFFSDEDQETSVSSSDRSFSDADLSRMDEDVMGRFDHESWVSSDESSLLGGESWDDAQ